MSDWRLIRVVNWSENYEETKGFLEDYPEFEEFFEYKLADELLRSMLENIDLLEIDTLLKRLLRKDD